LRSAHAGKVKTKDVGRQQNTKVAENTNRNDRDEEKQKKLSHSLIKAPTNRNRKQQGYKR
jgi:hypothetical protein